MRHRDRPTKKQNWLSLLALASDDESEKRINQLFGKEDEESETPGGEPSLSGVKLGKTRQLSIF